MKIIAIVIVITQVLLLVNLFLTTKPRKRNTNLKQETLKRIETEILGISSEK